MVFPLQVKVWELFTNPKGYLPIGKLQTKRPNLGSSSNKGSNFQVTKIEN